MRLWGLMECTKALRKILTQYNLLKKNIVVKYENLMG